MTKKIVIAGVSSGVGKTMITMGLIAAFHRKGLQIQPFKAGPDYIDPTYHTLAASRPCRNVDTWMVPPERAKILFQQALSGSDIAIIEGVMGLFDGFSYETEEGSSAQIAKLLNTPVLLILDIGKMARSAGALAKGYVDFDPQLKIAGFILNRCGSPSHYQGVKLAVETATGLPVVGWLPKRDEKLHIPERHLGLVPTNERGQLDSFIKNVSDVVEQYFALDQIWELAERDEGNGVTALVQQSVKDRVRIAVARDKAFSFYYEDSLDLLRETGAEIIFFSPLTDSTLPPDIHGLYLGGGFPEIYAAQLAANKPMLTAIHQAHARDIPIYAECGGFMYLTEAIIDLGGEAHSMVGIIPGLTRMQPRLMSLGYRRVESPTGNFLLPQGATTRGHEFHWSSWEIPPEANISPAWHISPRWEQEKTKHSGYTKGNLIASYIHLHFAHDLQLAPNFVRTCHHWKHASES